MIWQSIRSIIPPWPGIKESKSFKPYARLIAEAKNPPNGATIDANRPYTIACIWIGYNMKVPRYGIAVGVSRKTGFGSQLSGGGNGLMYRPSAGQVNQVNCAKYPEKKKQNITVQIPAPMKPSHVLFGDNNGKNGALINFLPKQIPEK